MEELAIGERGEGHLDQEKKQRKSCFCIIEKLCLPVKFLFEIQDKVKRNALVLSNCTLSSFRKEKGKTLVDVDFTQSDCGNINKAHVSLRPIKNKNKLKKPT